MPENETGAVPDLGRMLPRLARWAVRDHLLGVTPGRGDPPDGYLAERRGVFVTIRDREGRLRGCRGTIEPQHNNLIEETRAVALSSAFRDTRFEPVQSEDMPHLVFEVSVLHSPEQVPSREDLDPAVYGVILETADGRRGLMLPMVEGLETPAAQIDATLRKAGIRADEPFTLFRFRVDKFSEPVAASSREGHA